MEAMTRTTIACVTTHANSGAGAASEIAIRHPMPMDVGCDDCEDDQALEQLHGCHVMPVKALRSRFVAPKD